MADTPVHSLTNGAPGSPTDETYITRSPFGVGDDRRLSVQALYNVITSLTASAGLDGADQFPVYDAGSGATLKATLTQLASFLGASLGLLKTSGDPEGVLVCPTTAGIAYDPTTGGLWCFNGVAGTNTGWVTFIAPP